MSSSEFQRGTHRDNGQVRRDKGQVTAPPLPPVLDEEPAPEPAEKPTRLTALYGKTVWKKARFPLTGTLFALLAVGCAALAFTHIGRLLGGAVGCASVAAVFFWGMRRGVWFHFSEEGVEFGPARTPFFLAYEEILEVFVSQADEEKATYPIQLLTADGCETLPGNLTVSSKKIRAFLASQPLGERPIEDLDDEFDTFLRHQRALHRPEDIFVYRARQKKKAATAHWNWGMMFGMGLILAGLVYFVIWAVLRGLPQAVPHADAAVFVVLGFAALGLGAFIYLLGILGRRPGVNYQIKNWRKSLLIISPGGLALSLGDIRGEMRWEELLDLHVKYGRILTLKLKGVNILVQDVFHWPLEHIAEVSRYYQEKAED